MSLACKNGVESVSWDMQAYIWFGKLIGRNTAKLFIKLLLIVLPFFNSPPPHSLHKTWIYMYIITVTIKIGKVQNTRHLYYY
jgi:hypothetical protein